MENLHVRVAYANTVLNDIQNYAVFKAHKRYAGTVKELITDMQTEIGELEKNAEALKERTERAEKNRTFWHTHYAGMRDKRDKAEAEVIRLSDEVESLKERSDADAQLISGLKEELAYAKAQRDTALSLGEQTDEKARHQIETLKNEKDAVVAELEQTRADFEAAQWEGINADVQNAAELEALRDQHCYTRETLRTVSEALDRKSERIGELERCVNEAMENVRKEQLAHAETEQQLAEAKTRAAQWTRCYYTEVKACVEAKQQLAAAERRAVQLRDTFNAEFTAHTETKQHLTETRRQLTDAQLQAQMAWEARRKLAAKCK